MRLKKRKKIIYKAIKPKENEKLYAIAIGEIVVSIPASERAAKDIKKLKGFVAFHFIEEVGTLVFFDTVNNAKMARNYLEYRGVTVGKNIAIFEGVEDGSARFVGGV